MMLTDWRRTFDMESEIRKILMRDGAADLSYEACVVWAREFIQDLIPGWRPGKALGVLQARWVGAAFEREVRSVTRWQRKRLKQ